MRILIAANSPSSELYAVPRIAARLGTQLKLRGHEVDYAYAGHFGSRFGSPRVSSLAFPLALARQAARKAPSGGYDVVFAHSGTGWAYGVLKRLTGRQFPRLVTFSQGWEDLLWQQYLREVEHGRAHLTLRHRLYYPAVHIGQARLAARMADAAVCCSTEEASYLVDTLGLEGDKVHFVPNGVGADYFDLAHDYAGVGSRLLCVSYWSWRKGQHYLLEALDQLRFRHPDLTLSLVGTRLSEREVLSQIAPHLHPLVRVVPEVDEACVQREYQMHDLLVMPTLFEGMSLVMLEAMAAGLPVVATATSGALDLIEDGDNGILVPRRDVQALAGAIDRMFSDRESRRKMALAAREGTRHLTWDKVAGRLLGVFEGLGATGQRSVGG